MSEEDCHPENNRKGCLILQSQKPEMNCSICHKPVALETAKTDEVGEAVHEECYILNAGIKRDQAPQGKSKADR